MSARYAPIPNPRTDPRSTTEMDAAFDDSDDDDDDDDDIPLAQAESRPLNARSAQPAHSRAATAGTYDFENIDYANFPPPGSPPGPSSQALPNDIGNSNGLVPSLEHVVDAIPGPRRAWWSRAAASVLPHSYVQRWGLDYERPAGVVGGGTGNDGVFANVTAKPSRPMEIRQGDEIFLVPEEAQKDVPPSYAAAQLDAVPPYWETTVHAPSSTDTYGEMIIDALPTGSLFSFLWNFLVSVSFQFVGFLLTYLLHTTHAARFGSRAGLGVTLIQYGFALRSRGDQGETDGWGWRMDGGMQRTQPAEPTPTFETAAQAEEYYRNVNATITDASTGGTVPDNFNLVNEATTDWLSFFLMTVGWFILLTSLLGYWRVKRWERNILVSQQDSPANIPDAQTQQRAISSSLQRVFGTPMPDVGGMLRAGLGFGGSSRHDHWNLDVEDGTEVVRAVEEGATPIAEDLHQREVLLQMYAHDPERQRQLVQAFRDDDQLMDNMRNAGML